MKLYIDDERPVPDGWVSAKTEQTAIDMLRDNNVTHVSFDHDLGLNSLGDEMTGYAVVTWLEMQIHFNPAFPVPEMYCHSDNGPGADRIRATITAIHRRLQQ